MKDFVYTNLHIFLVALVLVGICFAANHTRPKDDNCHMGDLVPSGSRVVIGVSGDDAIVLGFSSCKGNVYKYKLFLVKDRVELNLKSYEFYVVGA